MASSHDTTLVPRGSASVAGTPTCSRSLVSSRARRYNHSHGGGARTSSAIGAGSSGLQNEFPVFSASGDVEIMVRTASGYHGNRYLLHRHTLTRCSGFFEASTSNEWSRAKDLAGVQAIEAARGEVDGLGGDDKGSGSSDESRSTAALVGLAHAPRKRWRYELDSGTGDDDVPMLVQVADSNPSARASKSVFGGSPRPAKHASLSHSFFRSVANLSLSHHSSFQLPPPSQAEQDVLRDHDNLFRIMYNYAPLLDAVNIADAYVQCKSLLTVADQYDALAVVGPRVDHHLLQFQSRLWRQIAKYPISYLRLGHLARSKVIFQEALIHVVGQWPAGERSLRAAMPQSVLDLIEDKVDELEETVSRVEARLFRLGLATRSGDRVSPHTAYLDWLAMSLFRQWLAENTSPPPPHLPAHRAHTAGPPSSRVANTSLSRAAPPPPHFPRPPLPALPAASFRVGRAYRLLGSTVPSAYLGHDECKHFLKLTPDLYSRDNLRRFEKRMDELKAMAREVVQPLMGSGLELDQSSNLHGGGSAMGYLTFTSLAERELPWGSGMGYR